MPMNNKAEEIRVWIEIEGTADAEEGAERARLLNKMLERLGCAIDPMHGIKFEWLKDRHYAGTPGYIFYMGGGSYVELSDNGRWFNLRFLAGEK